jgi:DNA-binding MarR family transcriptional regulator
MNGPTTQNDRGDVTAQLVQLLPELAVTLYQAGPHEQARRQARGEGLTGRQMKAVVFLAHRGKATMGEFADGLEIGRAAASELAARLLDKGVVRREHDPDDHRLVRVSLAGAAERYAENLLAQWGKNLEATFARFPDIDPDTLVAFLCDLIVELKGRPQA